MKDEKNRSGKGGTAPSAVAPVVDVAADPFALFTEWASAADAEAYDLLPVRRR